MHLRCPHCHNAIDVVQESPILDVTCPSCGSRWRPSEPGTETIRDTTVKTVGRFQLLELIGTGHFGEVWSAHDPTLDRKVAIKLPRKGDLDEDDIERFLREARAAAQLKHPNIVGVLEVGREDDLLYIVSDLIDGVSLTDWINAKRLLSFEETAKLCATLADALHYAHEQGVIHRDLKPSNVLLNGAGEPHLTDFGLAKRESGEITMTIEGRILGTPAYMSPEQARGEGHHADRRSDVYSLGVLLFELLTGQRPFKGNSRLLLHQVLHEDPRPPRKLNSKIPKDLQTICLKAMEKSPARRYASAKDMADDLRRYLAGQALVARPIGRVERCRRWSRHNPIVATLVATILVLVTSFGVLYARYRSERQEHAPLLRTVLVTTNPPGARFVCVPLSKTTGEPMVESKVRSGKGSPPTVKLEPGDYLVEAEVPGHGFHEVLRYVPRRDDLLTASYPHKKWTDMPDGSITWPVIQIPVAAEVTRTMTRFEGGTIRLTLPPALAALENPKARAKLLEKYPAQGPTETVVESFFMDTTEMTVGECRRLSNQKGRLPGDIESFLESVPDDHPATMIRYDRVVVYAELAGKRLPKEAEYVFAATAGGRQSFPWGNDASLITSWEFGPVRQPEYDRTTTVPPVFGLYSGPAEWTWSWHNPLPGEPMIPLSPTLMDRHPDNRVVRGGPFSVIKGTPDPKEWSRGPHSRMAMNVSTHEKGLGFRCVRSEKPRFLD